MTDLVVREITESEVVLAADVLGNGMRDNPLHIKAFGPSDDERQRALSSFFAPVLARGRRVGIVLGAFRRDELVGVCGVLRPGRCRLSALDRLRVMPRLVTAPGVIVPILRWTNAWERYHPRDSHWHLGPVGVRRELQGLGIGTQLMRACDEWTCTETAYLETDKAENVRFYERFGFTVVATGEVLEVPNWFMRREPNHQES